MPEIYFPAEDSYLLSEVLKKQKINSKDKILDMGAGTGIQAKSLLSKLNSENITLADINSTAIKFLRKKFPKSKTIKSNLFQNIKSKFDIIIFNPPYLPAHKFDKKSDTTGGKKGGEIINKFLRQTKKHLNKKGRIFLLTSSLTKGILWNGYQKKLLAKKRIFFEELYVWKLTFGNQNS